MPRRKHAPTWNGQEHSVPFTLSLDDCSQLLEIVGWEELGKQPLHDDQVRFHLKQLEKVLDDHPFAEYVFDS